MTRYGHPLEFGVFLTPLADRQHGVDQVLGLARLAEEQGYDVVSLQDHPYQERFGDTWTLLSLIGAHTSRIKVSPNVANLPLRSPVLLAKAAATLDLATGGRVELGLGAGAFWDAIAAAGGPRRTPKQAVDATIEAITLMRRFWDGGTLRFDGEFYQAMGLHAGPQPAHPIPIWLGALKPRMLGVTGRLADAWVPSLSFVPPSAVPEMNERIDAAAVKAGRSPADITRIYNINGGFGTGSGPLQGTPSDWAEQLAGFAIDLGFSTFILAADDPTMMTRFVQEVVPQVRELVDSGTTTATPTATTTPAGAATTAGAATAASPGQEPAGETALTIRPTPDDGTRLTDSMPWDESTRPHVDEPAGQTYTAAQEAVPEHFVEVHDALRQELAQIRDVIGQVRQGATTAAQARSLINTMALRQNNWTLGAFCETYCRFVTGHHTLEDATIFPHLRRSEPALEPVLDRLTEEHHVIAAVLDQLDRALVALVAAEPGRASLEALDAVEREVDELTDTMVSHLAYEERELLGPLARYGFN